MKDKIIYTWVNHEGGFVRWADTKPKVSPIYAGLCGGLLTGNANKAWTNGVLLLGSGAYEAVEACRKGDGLLPVGTLDQAMRYAFGGTP